MDRRHHARSSCALHHERHASLVQYIYLGLCSVQGFLWIFVHGTSMAASAPMFLALGTMQLHLWLAFCGRCQQWRAYLPLRLVYFVITSFLMAGVLLWFHMLDRVASALGAFVDAEYLPGVMLMCACIVFIFLKIVQAISSSAFVGPGILTFWGLNDTAYLDAQYSFQPSGTSASQVAFSDEVEVYDDTGMNSTYRDGPTIDLNKV